MNVRAEVARIEARLKTAGYPVAELLRKADVDVAQWQRWKAGKQTPLVTTWAKISDAADALIPETSSQTVHQ